MNIIHSLQLEKEPASVATSGRTFEFQGETEIKETLDRKSKYKERARKYKQLLRKRDKEIMDLVIEGKDLRIRLDKSIRKQQELKARLKGEVVSLKDELQ
mmetsp:Transcript_33113/g.24359  ORF Transcript_33113/g.24359 Transcript_33113/m.24359 type:complete len:100 (+) Transcript_33113:152-451(+)